MDANSTYTIDETVTALRGQHSVDNAAYADGVVDLLITTEPVEALNDGELTIDVDTWNAVAEHASASRRYIALGLLALAETAHCNLHPALRDDLRPAREQLATQIGASSNFELRGCVEEFIARARSIAEQVIDTDGNTRFVSLTPLTEQVFDSHTRQP